MLVEVLEDLGSQSGLPFRGWVGNHKHHNPLGTPYNDDLSACVYIYIHICIHRYIYIYTNREREGERERDREREREARRRVVTQCSHPSISRYSGPYSPPPKSPITWPQNVLSGSEPCWTVSAVPECRVLNLAWDMQ